MHRPYNPEMEADDRQFHDEEINDDRIMTDPTPLADWLNMQLAEYKNLFAALGLQFNEEDNAQLAKLAVLLYDKAHPVGSVVYMAMSLEKFSEKNWGTWVHANGSVAPESSKFHKDKLGFEESGKQYLPDCRRILRAPHKQSELNVNRGLLEDQVDVSGITVSGGKVTGKISTTVSFLRKTTGNSGVTLVLRKMSSHKKGAPLVYNGQADDNHSRSSVSTGHHGGHVVSEGLYSSSQEFSQNLIQAKDHSHDLNLSDTFSGSFTEGSVTGIGLTSGATETRPKTQLLNAFVRID